ncbi:Spermidine/putrescine transport system permease protein PotB [Bradyrhizobium ivorense]|uniref:Spermidine/putrescine transport system permease protein PotB n=1 Tax=Bradyrhizobium ivorense TaxID=2511166 RepID=A0A508T6M0_9BRAD|nr:ABC transporter permease [Bradyrhizobium ivorense]VIO69770.1 Spermidine/putrescine transport system permease protein PotB [Bradyrhizobium ivorense]VIO70573.1 Spermidine/putrescine transport system permease protein PotB [Bradyrhizobium ivorense]
MILSRKAVGPWLLLTPALLFLCIFFVYPLCNMLARSAFDPAPTLRHYTRLINEPAYLRVLLTTFEISLSVTLSALVIGYPLAYFLSQLKLRTANFLMVLVIVPYFTSVLVRTYAWMVLLGTEGILNQVLLGLGLVTRPLAIMFSRTSVVIGMTYILLPYMVLALYSVMRGIDTHLLHAAESLGAGRIRAFWRVFVPLSMPGVAAGGLLVAILSIGFFITPALMGNQQDSMISMLIEAQVETYFDWGFASALASILLACTLLLFLAYDRMVGLNRLFEAKQ